MIKLEVSPQTLDVIMNALGQRPWLEVNQVILDLARQANTPRPAEIFQGPQQSPPAESPATGVAQHPV